jgi:hypothetical protein
VTGTDRELAGWQPVLPGAPDQTFVKGRVPAGTVLAAVAPAADWRLTGPRGVVEHASKSFGYAPTFHVARPGSVAVAFVGSWAHGLEIAAETAAWIAVAVALAGPRWWRDWWWGPLRRRGARRRRRRDLAATALASEPPSASPEAADPMQQAAL